jgi:protein SCO1/2
MPSVLPKSRLFKPAHLRHLMLIAGALLLSLGGVLSFAGAAFLREIALALGMSAVWDAVCGGPVAADPNAPAVFVAGIAASVLGGGALIAASPARRGWMATLTLGVMGLGLTAGYVNERTGFVLNLSALPVPPSGQYTRLDPPREMPNFILRNADGGLTELRDFRGRAVLMFFGYTHCPDVCPMTLSDYKHVKRLLGADADKVAFAFISVDGERDDPAFLKKYIQVFDPDFVALTAHPSVVASIERDYGGGFIKDTPASALASTSATAANYKLNHTADTYVLDAQGRWRLVLPITMTPEEVAIEVRAVLSDQ